MSLKKAGKLDSNLCKIIRILCWDVKSHDVDFSFYVFFVNYGGGCRDRDRKNRAFLWKLHSKLKHKFSGKVPFKKYSNKKLEKWKLWVIYCNWKVLFISFVMRYGKNIQTNLYFLENKNLHNLWIFIWEILPDKC